MCGSAPVNQKDIDRFYKCWQWQERGTVWQERPKCRSWFQDLDFMPADIREKHAQSCKKHSAQIIRIKR